MDFQEVLRHRRMVRQFTADPVPQESINRMLANAACGNSQMASGDSILTNAPTRSPAGDGEELIPTPAAGDVQATLCLNLKSR